MLNWLPNTSFHPPPVWTLAHWPTCETWMCFDFLTVNVFPTNPCVTILETLHLLTVSSIRRTLVCSVWWWTPIKCCQSTQRRSLTCTRERNDMKFPLIFTPSLIMPTETWCKVGSLHNLHSSCDEPVSFGFCHSWIFLFTYSPSKLILHCKDLQIKRTGTLTLCS